MTKPEIREKIINSRIVIWGWGESGRSFFEAYGNRITELYFSSSNKDEMIEELLRVEINGKYDVKNSYILIGSSAYAEISNHLIEIGLHPVEDFLTCDLASSILENKRILLAVGQCEFEITNYIYRNMKSFTNLYYSLYFDEYNIFGIMDKQPQKGIVLTVQNLMGLADFFIYPVNLMKERQEYYEKMVNNVSQDCIVVGVPLTTFEGYWPQDNLKNYYAVSPYYKKNKAGEYPFFNRRDMNIEKYVEEGITNTDFILGQLEKDDYYSENEVIRLLDRTIKKYKVLEKRADIKISDYLENNYALQRMFKDRGHAESVLLREYARRILKYLKILFCDEELEQVNLKWYDRCHTEFPIYPSVQKFLNFTKLQYQYQDSEGKMILLDFRSYEKKILKHVDAN